jgi:hypothetical protein
MVSPPEVVEVITEDMEVLVEPDGSKMILPVDQAYPKPRPALARTETDFNLPTLQAGHQATREGYSRREREDFVSSPKVSDRVRAMLNQPFGKDNLDQFFVSEAAMRHILLPLRQSLFLEPCDWYNFRCASRKVFQLSQVYEDLCTVDFNPLRGFQADWENLSEVCPHRARMASAALMHFHGDAAALVRWMGGPHVHAQRDVPALLNFLDGKVEPALIYDIRRTFTKGIPRTCRAFSTEANFQAFYNYGNHTSHNSAPDKVAAALAKDAKRGFVIPFDTRVVPFVLNCHVTPQGMIDLDTPYKSPRSIFDSSFRPEVWCTAINDWTSMAGENPVTCVEIELEFMQWIWNLRISYPDQELYLADDDVSGAFRWLKYHPNLVAMHTSMQAGFAVFNSGGTFGDNTTPPGWDPLAKLRRDLARWLWLHSPTVVEDAAPYLPPLRFSPPPTASEVATFVPAFRDSLNSGVFDANGNRLPPPCPHHVDDKPDADIMDLLPRAVSCGTMSLYHTLGFPEPVPRVPNPLSLEKLNALYTWERRIVGRLWNTRRMTVGMLPHKRVELLARFSDWLSKQSFNLRELAELLGVLVSHVRYVPWARPWLFAIHNQLRRLLLRLWGISCRIKARSEPRREAQLRQILPNTIWNRIQPILSRERAEFLWNHRLTMKLDVHLRHALQRLQHYVSSTERPWEAKIGTIIPREPQVEAFGDASELGGGGFCAELRVWFDILWSPRIQAGMLLPSTSPDHIHINMLEFVVVILVLAALITAFQSLTPAELAAWFPNGLPAIPVIRERCDNTSAVSWANKVTTSSPHGQKLLGIYSELLRSYDLSLRSDHIEGERNVAADFLSRPTNPSLSHAARAEQIFQSHPSMRSWRIFLPSPELLQLLTSALFSPLQVEPPRLPPLLGQLVHDASTSSCTPSI